jgi:hypothetical protein
MCAINLFSYYDDRDLTMAAEQRHQNKLHHDNTPDHTHKMTFSCYRKQTFSYDSITCRRFEGFQPYLKAVDNMETLLDRDGNVYRTVKLGDQVFPVEKLQVTKYNNGT